MDGTLKTPSTIPSEFQTCDWYKDGNCSPDIEKFTVQAQKKFEME
jgi:hypothetical protein